jgi:hypothetical protein
MEAIIELLEHMEKSSKVVSFGPPCMRTQKTLLDDVLDAKNMGT